MLAGSFGGLELLHDIFLHVALFFQIGLNSDALPGRRFIILTATQLRTGLSQGQHGWGVRRVILW